MIKYYLPMLKDNAEIRESFMRVTGASEKDFNGVITFGNGPWITPTRPQDESWDRQSSTNPEVGSDNQFYPHDPKYRNNIFIASHRLDDLEKEMQAALQSGNAESIMKQMFLVAIAVMHESVHRSYLLTHGYNNSNFKDIDQGGDDKGFVWTKLAFGSRLTKYNRLTEIEMMDEDQVFKKFDQLRGRPILQGLTLSSHLGGFYNRMIFKNKGAAITPMTGDPTVKGEDRQKYNGSYSYQMSTTWND